MDVLSTWTTFLCKILQIVNSNWRIIERSWEFQEKWKISGYIGDSCKTTLWKNHPSKIGPLIPIPLLWFVNSQNHFPFVLQHDTENIWNSGALYISMHSTHKFGAPENFHFECIIKTTGRYYQLSRVMQIKPHYIKTRCSQPAQDSPSSNSLQWAHILRFHYLSLYLPWNLPQGSVYTVKWGVERSPGEGIDEDSSGQMSSPFPRFCSIIPWYLLFNLLA